MMTEKELQYQLNAQKCRAMGHYLELLVGELKYHELVLDVYNRDITEVKIKETIGDIQALFDVQLELKSEIEYEFKSYRKGVYAEFMRSKRNLKHN